jgi:group I intron endonuclease
VALATLPTGHKEFENADESKGLITTEFRRNRGVYLWTNKINQNQYIGSAINLSSRLSDYYRESYLKHEVSRNSAISQALLKYGHSNFSLQVLSLGDSIMRSEVSMSPGLIVLEQYYLDRYKLVYNLRRIALGPAPSANIDSESKKGPLKSSIRKIRF